MHAKDGSPDIKLSGTINGKDFYILERTDDSTLPKIKADFIYTGALSNQGENLELLDSQGNIIDQVIHTEGWPAGDNQTKQTMERIPATDEQNSEWQTSQNPAGTPRAENSPGRIAAAATETRSLLNIKLREAEPPSISAKIVALATALFSAATIAFLNRKLKKN